MKKLLATIFFLSIIGFTAYSQNQFTVQTTAGNTSFYSNLTDAVTASSNGDIIYVPAGSYNVDGIMITKGVHIIGTGHNPDSTGATGGTYFTGYLRFLKGADNGSLQGITLSGSLIFGKNDSTSNVSNFVISRCHFYSGIQLAYEWNAAAHGSNFQISECIIEGAIFGGYAQNVTINNNILIQTVNVARLFTCLTNATITNNVIITIDNVVSNSVNGTTFKNNVVLNNNLGYCNDYSNNVYLNNLYADTNGLNKTGVIQSSGNVRLDRDKMLVKQSGGAFSYTDDYHLTPAAISAITGTDGTQVGIYGTNNPYKEGSLPPNPHYQYIKVAPVTKSDSKLNVDIKVQAQTK